MRILRDNPLILIHEMALLILIKPRPPPAVDKVSDILFLTENIGNGPDMPDMHLIPFFLIQMPCLQVLSGNGKIPPLQFQRYFPHGHPDIRHLVHIPHDRCRRFINQKMPQRILVIDHIAIRRITAGELSTLHFLPADRGNPLGNILRVHIVDQILQRDLQGLILIAGRVRIKMVIDRYEPHAQERKDDLDIIGRFQIVPAKARQILHKDTVDLARPDIIH